MASVVFSSESADRPSGPSAEVEAKTARAGGMLQTQAAQGRERPRIKPMTTLGAGAGVATTLMTTPLGEVLPGVLRVTVATSIAAASAVPQLKEFFDQMKARVQYERRKRRGGATDAD